MLTNENYISAKCQENELKGRYVAEKCLSELLKNYEYTVTSTELSCPVDLKCCVTSTNNEIKFNVEVKQRTKNEEQLLKYPNCELKVDKFNRMLTETPIGTSLIYMVLLNESTCYFFNLRKMDWNQVTTFDWRIKKTQVDPNSPYLVYPTYSIPTSLAFAKMDCSKYFQQWN